MPPLNAHRRGFTLIEMLIVGSLIVLFAGLAMIGAQQMFDSNKKKAVMDEVKSIATALSAARQDVGFYPRLYTLGMPVSLILFAKANGNMTNPAAFVYYTRAGLDTYGFYYSGASAGIPTQPNCAFKIKNFWNAPYMSVTEARKANASGGRHTGLVKVRLMEPDAILVNPAQIGGEDPTLVEWPADPWGNPYAIYHVSIDGRYLDSAANPKGLRFILSPTEEANYFNAVVSYGPNGVPGGNDKANPNGNLPGGGNDHYGFPDQALFIKGDQAVQNGPADFTLKSARAQDPIRLPLAQPQTLPPADSAAMALYAQSMECRQTKPGYIGIFDDGSDDIFIKF